jgi:DHA1 family tetracycline resistance protein-like MFS transporter
MSSEVTKERFFTPPLIIIFVTVFIDLVGFGIVIPILPFYANNAPFYATPLEVGMLWSIYSWMQFFFAPILGRLSDRYGRRPILFISLLGSAVGFLILGLAGSMLALFIGRIVGGITGANISTAQAYIADVTTRENRAKGMGLFGAAFGLGFILGPALAGILSGYGVHVPFYFAAGLSFANAIALYFLLPESVKPGSYVEKPKTSRMMDIFRSLSDKRFGLLNLDYFLLVTAFSIMTYAFVLFTSYRFNYDAAQNGYMFMFIGIIAVVGQGVLFGRLERNFGESRLIIAGCVMMAVALFLMPIIGPDYGGLAALLAVGALLSLGNSLASPAITSLASRITNEDEQGSALGIMQSGASLARAIAPMIGGVLLNNAVGSLDDQTISRTFITASGIMVLALIVAIYAHGNLSIRDSGELH